MKRMLIRMLLGCLAVVCFLDVSAQNKKVVTGTVKDPDGKAVAAATVKEKGTTNQVATDANGVFKISMTPGGTLVVSYVGFETLEFPDDGSANPSIQIQPDNKQLTGVVVTALGIKREKKSLGYAVQEVKGETLVSAREPNLANALVGKVAGLQVVRSSDGPAGSSKIILRGSNSLTGSNQPLIVVDGIPIDNFTGAADNGYWNRSLDMGNGIADINPEDIESLSVLKGPSAAALYGSRAGNGVILITTKTGRKQAGLGITLTSTVGVENIFTNPEMQNTYGQGMDGVAVPDATTSWGTKAQTFDNVDNFMQQGFTQNHSVSFQQQYKSTSVYTSATYMQDNGLVEGTKLTRVNLTGRSVSRFGKDDRWTLDTKVQYSNAKGNNRPVGGRDNSSAYTLYMLPRSLDIRKYSNPVDQNGNMVWFPGAGNQVNPYWMSQYNLNEDIRDRYIMAGSLKYNFTSWLNAEIKAGMDQYTSNTQGKTYGGSPLTPTGRYTLGKSTFGETNFSTLISARKDNLFGKFGGALTLGGNMMSQKFSSISSNSGVLVVPNLFSLNNGVNAATVGEGFNQKKINSVYGTAQLNYDGWLYLDATFRNDWSSALSETNRSFFYPSLSLSYVFTDMLKSMGVGSPDWFTYGKLRASYAEVGNDLPAYQLYNVYRIGKDPNGNTTASRDNVLLDPNVQSELIKNLEFGAELRFFRNRLGVDLSWYKSNATHQLIDLPMDPQSGYTAKKINAGNIQNKGYEIMVDARILDKPDGLSWNLGLNYSSNDNTVEELAEGVTKYGLGGFDDVQVLAVVGQKYGEIYGTKFNRVKDVNSKDFGKIILNADGLPTRDPEIVRLGNQQADGLFGITNSFAYKGLEFSFLFDARMGGEIFSATQVAMQAAGTAGVTAPGGNRENFVVDGVVAKTGGGYDVNTKSVSQQQYWRAVATANNLGVTEANLYDASSFRLRNIQLNYIFSNKLLKNTPIQKAKIGVSCNNVWMISSHVRGIDPESVYATNTNATGFENAGLPTTRTFLMNLTLTF